MSDHDGPRRHDHHRHVRRRAVGGGRRARGPRLLRDRQPAAGAHPQGRRARASGAKKPPPVRARRRRALRRVHPRPRGRARRAARAGRATRGCCSSTRPTTCSSAASRRPAAAPARRRRPRVRRHRARARAARGAQGRGRPRRRHVRPQRPRAARPAARAVRRGRRRPTARCRPASCRSATSTACRSTSTSCSTAGSSPTRTGSTSCARFPAPTPRCATTCSASPKPQAFLAELERLFALLLPAYVREGKAYLSIGIGCTGGRHRSVVIADGARRACSSGLGFPPERAPPGPRPWLTRRPPTGPPVVALGGGHGLATALRAIRRYAGVDHRDRERGRRRRLVGPAPPRPRRAPARRPAQVPRRAAPTTTLWAARVRAPLRRRRARRPRARQPRARRAGRDARRLRRRARRGRAARRRGRPGAAGDHRAGRAQGRGRRRRDGRGPGRGGDRTAAASAGSSSCRPTPAPPPTRSPRSPPPTRSCSRPARSTPACSRCSASAALRGAVAAHRAGSCRWRTSRPQLAETAGLDAADHLRAVLDHGGRVDTFLYQRGRASWPADDDRDPGARGVEPVARRSSPTRRGPSTIPDDWRRRSRALL